MLTLVTGFAYLFNGVKFGMDGVEPDHFIPEDQDSLEFVLDKYKKGELFGLASP